MFTSVYEAVTGLNSAKGSSACPEGFCVVFSKKRKAYFLIYREDKKDEALRTFELAEMTAPSGWQEIRSASFSSCSIQKARQNELEDLYDDDWVQLGKSQRPLWDISQTAFLCLKGEEHRFHKKAELLKPDQFPSVASAVTYLNTAEGHIACPEGFCITFSQSRNMYFVIYRQDRKDEVLDLFGLFESTIAPSGWLRIRSAIFSSACTQKVRQNELLALYDDDWAKLGTSQRPQWDVAQTAFLCLKGQEQKFRGKAELLKTEEFTSVSAAVTCLSTFEGHTACPEGFCIVFSEARQMYYVVYRKDKKDKAFELFGLAEVPHQD